MDVADFLELQRPLKRDRIVVAPTQIQPVLLRVVNLRDRLRVFRLGEDGFDLLRNLRQGADELARRRRLASTATCPVKAFVLATPISGPT